PGSPSPASCPMKRSPASSPPCSRPSASTPSTACPSNASSPIAASVIDPTPLPPPAPASASNTSSPAPTAHRPTARPSASSTERAGFLPHYILEYNHYRPHSALNQKPPITRLPLYTDNVSRHNS